MHPKNPFHPGEILLEEFLEPAGISQASPGRGPIEPIGSRPESVTGARGRPACSPGQP